MKQRSLAVLLLSGGLDSATTLAIAHQNSYDIVALSFDYGQKHRVELQCAKQLARHYAIKRHQIIVLDPQAFQGSSLTSNPYQPAEQEVPKHRYLQKDDAMQALSSNQEIPSTYVPARNTIFLAYALGLAESLHAFDLFIGCTAVDYSGYPDCRAEFLEAFVRMADLATKDAVSGKGNYKLHAPLLHLSKKEIIQRGHALGLDYSMSHSCYDPIGELACGHCDACYHRKEGFRLNALADPTRYVAM